MLKHLRKSSTLSYTATIFRGQILAQVFGLLASIFLSTIYAPELFASLAVTLAAASILVPLLTGSLENAVILELDQVKAEQTMKAALMLVLFLVVVFVGLAVFSWGLGLDLKVATFRLNGLVVGVSGLNAATLICQSVLIRLKQFTKVNHLIALPVFLNPLFASLLWLAGYRQQGLVLSLLLSCFLQLVYAGLLVSDALRRTCRIKPLLSILKTHRSYPLFVSTAAALDAVTISLPILVGGLGQSPAIIGNYALMLKVLVLPLSLMAAALSKSYLSQASERRRDSPLGFFDHTVKLLSLSTLIAAVYVLVVIGVAFPVARLFVVQQWEPCLTIFQILAPGIIVKFASSSLASSLLAVNAKAYLVGWKLVAFVSTLATTSRFVQGSYQVFFGALMVNDVVLYAVLFALILLKCRPLPASHPVRG